MNLDQAQGMLVGLAVGDAVGTTVEFQPRGSFAPVTDMVGGGPFKLEKGQWTDDTSMALCLAASLIEKQAFDARDQIEKYLRWRNHGYMSCTGHCFDIGLTVQKAINNYLTIGNPYAGSTNPRSAGNGSIMRLAPIVIAFAENTHNLLHFAGESSKITHATEESVEACRLFALLLKRACYVSDKHALLTGHAYQSTSTTINSIARGEYLVYEYGDLKGSGYVIESLESALWCFYHGSSFQDSILKAVNIGNDADTTAAICGQIAGAFYGLTSIPKAWKDSLSWSMEIMEMATSLLNLNFTSTQ